MKIASERGVAKNNGYPFATLWRSPAGWHEANQAMSHLIHLHRPELEQAVIFARGVMAQLVSIFSHLDGLCAVTCPWCPDPCCLTAKVWIDFQDLLFLHLVGQPPPAVQPMPDLEKSCCYVTHRGCALPRIMRPWICTRYLCPSQMANLRKTSLSTLDLFDQAFRTVKIDRNRMETEFIRIVS